MTVEIFAREKFALNVEKALVKKLSHFLPGVKKAAESKLYLVEGEYSAKDREAIAREVLLDKIVENRSFKPRKFSGRHIRLEIWYKDSITDVAAESVAGAIEDSGFKKPSRVRTGRAIYVFCSDFRKAERAVRENFTNELVHRIVKK